MTIREKLNALKKVKVQVYRDEISNLLKRILQDTYEPLCDCVNNFNIKGKNIHVSYSWYCRSGTENGYVLIPIEWLDDCFDYMAAYEKKQRIAQEERRKWETERETQASKRREKTEYEKYLELKEKYEGGAK